MEILHQLSICIERGKVDLQSPHPPDMKGMKGATDLTKEALESNISAKLLLEEALLAGMKRVGQKFRDGKIFIPEVLIAAKAMNASMELLKPYFLSGDVSYKGKIVLGTVAGDLHDIGKNILKMVLEGGGWQVIDLGINVSAEKFVNEIRLNDAKIVGLSALLTTTMQNMEMIVKQIKDTFNDVIVIIGGAPVTSEFAEKINADKYFPDPQGMLDFINSKLINMNKEK